MINLFQLAPADQSMDYLYRLFGYMGGVLSPTYSTSLLGTMFKTFNSVILAVAALLLLYVTVVGVMQTAHEGEFMGTKWNKIWVPIRTVLGIASLIPTASGYSAIQIVMMWIVVQGIGAADTLWSTALQFIQDNGGISGKPLIPNAGVSDTIQSLYQGLVCAATAKQSAADPSDTKGASSFCSPENNRKAAKNPFCQAPIVFLPAAPVDCDSDKCRFDVGPDGACGTLYYCNEQTACGGVDADQVACAACKAQKQVLQEIVPQVLVIASQFANVDYQYRSFYYGRLTVPPDFVTSYCDAKGIVAANCNATNDNIGAFPTPDSEDKYPNDASADAVNKIYWPYNLMATHTIDSGKTFVEIYAERYSTVVSEAALAVIGENDALGDKLAIARQNGWIYAGAFYYTLAGVNNNNLKNSLPEFSYNGKNPSKSDSMGRKYRNNYNAAGDLMSNISNTKIFSNSAELKGIGGVLGGVFGSIFETFQQFFVSDTNSDPLFKLQSLGAAIIWIVTAGFLYMLYELTGIGLAAFISPFGLGTGFVNPVGPTLTLMFFLLAPLILAAFGTLFVVGISLSVYVPLIPFLVFTFGAIGWLMATIEAMVAGPLVALGIISPAGQHELLGKAEHALMLMFGIFLRPSLMIFGFMAGMLLARVLIMLINGAFQLALASMVGASTGGAAALANPVVFILFYIFYAFTIVTALNKCFSTIYVIPQRVMGWIGGQAVDYGEGESLHSVKGGGMGAADKVGGQISGAKGTVQGGIKDSKEAKQGYADKKKGGGSSVSGGDSGDSGDRQ